MLHMTVFSFSFQNKSIVRDVSFAVEKGEYLTILGPNGAGKSTLLKCILRLHEKGRASGTITVAGRDARSYTRKELARTIAYVPQAGGRIPPFTVREFLLLGRYPHRAGLGALLPGDSDAVARALELTGMEMFAERSLASLSGGERQKAYLAAALAQETPVLLLDEPAAFLDVRHAAEVNALLYRLNREQGLTMLTVTHDVNHPLEAGGKTLVLCGGRHLYFGPSEDLAASGVLERAFEHTFTTIRNPRTGRTVLLPDGPCGGGEGGRHE